MFLFLSVMERAESRNRHFFWENISSRWAVLMNTALHLCFEIEVNKNQLEGKVNFDLENWTNPNFNM